MKGLHYDYMGKGLANEKRGRGLYHGKRFSTFLKVRLCNIKGYFDTFYGPVTFSFLGVILIRKS